MLNSSHTHRFAFISLCLALGACEGKPGPATSEPGDSDGTTAPCSSAACDPSTSSDGGTSDSTSGGITTDEPDPTEQAPPPACAPGAGDLSLEWSQADPQSSRGEAVAVGGGRVAWLAGDFDGSALRVHALAGGEALWEQPVSIELGEGELTFKDVVVDAAGGVVLAASTPEGGLVRWYDGSGGEQHEALIAGSKLAGVTGLGAGDVIVVGELEGDVLARRYAAGGELAWTQSFAEMGAAWAGDVARAPWEGVVVVGHSNQTPGPVVLAYGGAGNLQWSRVSAANPVEVAMGVAVDSSGRTYITISGELGGRIDRFDLNGGQLPAIALDFRPRAVAIDAEDDLVIAGHDFQDKIVVVERRDPEGALLARYERAGALGLGVAVDDECHTYVVGAGPNGAWLERLR